MVVCRSPLHLLLLGLSTTTFSILSIFPNHNEFQQQSSFIFLVPDCIPPNKLSSSAEVEQTYISDGIERAIPDFEKGGIMIFYHIYKTGGSTVHALMSDLVRTHEQRELFYFRTIRKEAKWEQCRSALQRASAKNNSNQPGQRVMYEFHIEYPAPRFPTLVQFLPWLNQCRSLAESQNIPFFAFTLIREPISHSLSFFNFFHIAVDSHVQWNPFRGEMETNNSMEKNFWMVFQGNRQCHFFDRDAEGVVQSPLTALKNPTDPNLLRKRSRFHGGDSMKNNNNNNSDVSTWYRKCRFQKVQRALRESLDWVGTTDGLQNETLPILSTILVKDGELGRNQPSRKVFSQDDHTKTIHGLHVTDLSPSALKRLEQETKWDQRLYDQAQERYRFYS